MNVLQVVKDNDQDYEWYPTTKEMIEPIVQDLKDNDVYRGSTKLMDIGAGDGNVFKLIKELYPNHHFKKYAIEKSQILIDQMEPDIYVVGTEFNEQNLIDKKMDIIFCNPPYSAFVYWMTTIINEANAMCLFFVVPDRWSKNNEIEQAVKRRKAETSVLGNFSFLDSEYRKARAQVDIVKVDLSYRSYGRCVLTDPFTLWFKENFKFSAEKSRRTISDKIDKKREEIKALTTKKDLIPNLVRFFNDDMDNLFQNYKDVGELDATILDELNISVTSLRGSIETKIESLKDVYWKELFDNLDTITERLTSTSRSKLLATLFENTSVDFTAKNIYSVVMWAIRNANKYFDDQLLSLYSTLSDRKNVKLYKSNFRLIEDGWRYSRRDISHYTLDYRIIHSAYGSFDSYTPHCLKDHAIELIQDLFTIGNNLGFEVIEDPKANKWEPGKKQIFHYINSAKKNTIFCDIKVYLNGNIHFRLNQEFMKKLNIEAGRLNNWIKSPQEASSEMEIPINDVLSMYKANVQLISSNMLLLSQK